MSYRSLFSVRFFRVGFRGVDSCPKVSGILDNPGASGDNILRVPGGSVVALYGSRRHRCAPPWVPPAGTGHRAAVNWEFLQYCRVKGQRHRPWQIRGIHAQMRANACAWVRLLAIMLAG